MRFNRVFLRRFFFQFFPHKCMKLKSFFRKGIYSVSVMQLVLIFSSVFISAIEYFTIFHSSFIMALQTHSPRTSKAIQKQTAEDVQLNLDFILSMFEIIQTRKKCDRLVNDHVNSKTKKQTEEFQALRALHVDVPLKASTVKGWFNGIYDLIEIIRPTGMYLIEIYYPLRSFHNN